MRVIVTGSRNWDDPGSVWSALNLTADAADKAGEPELVVVHGACFPTRRDPVTGRLPLVSADYIAEMWCRQVEHPLPVRAERHPADWRFHKRGAGPIRNRVMARAGADLCLAFHRDGSAGTADMLRVAEEHGIRTRVVTYDEVLAARVVAP